MKLVIILNAFGPKTTEEKTSRIGNRIYDSLSDFNRKVHLMPQMMKIREICRTFDRERMQKINQLTREWCNEENERNKGKKNYANVQPSDFQELPGAKLPLMTAWFNERVNSEIDIDPIKFYPEEIAQTESDGFGPIDPEDLYDFKDFYDMSELQSYVQKNLARDKKNTGTD